MLTTGEASFNKRLVYKIYGRNKQYWLLQLRQKQLYIMCALNNEQKFQYWTRLNVYKLVIWVL